MRCEVFFCDREEDCWDEICVSRGSGRRVFFVEDKGVDTAGNLRFSSF